MAARFELKYCVSDLKTDKLIKNCRLTITVRWYDTGWMEKYTGSLDLGTPENLVTILLSLINHYFGYFPENLFLDREKQYTSSTVSIARKCIPVPASFTTKTLSPSRFNKLKR